MIKHWRKRLKRLPRALMLRSKWIEAIDEAKLLEERISIVLLTFQRPRFLDWCLASLLQSLAHPQVEVIVWNNDATDEATIEVLARHEHDARLRVVHSEENVGTNAYHFAFRDHAQGTYFVEMDDDVLWFPAGFDVELLRCLYHFPQLGFLSAAQISDRFTAETDPLTSGRFFYNRVSFPGDREIAFGPAQGHCGMTSRAVYEEVGGFPNELPQVFVSEDGHYNRVVRKAGYERGILTTLLPYHAQGPHCNFDYRRVFLGKNADANGRVGVDATPHAELVPGFIEYFQNTFLPAQRGQAEA